MNNFCAHPWAGLDISPQGDIKPCCKYAVTVGKNLKEYANSEHLKKLKDDILHNKNPEGCKRCWDDESAGLPSKRILDNQYIFKDSAPNTIKVLSLPFGNTCNLACRTCSSYSSSKWLADEKKLVKKFPLIKLHDHKKFYKDHDFLEHIKKITTDVSHITFPGGEPFITGIDEHLFYLDYLIETGRSNKISLTYITNCTTFPENKLWDKWKHFEHIEISLSIDQFGKKYEYIRFPAVWAEVYDNIKKYQSKQADNFKLSISHTVSIFNVLYLNDFLLWCYKEKLPRPYLGMVESPSQYNIKNLPNLTKKTVEKLLAPKQFEPVINFMNQPADQPIENFTDWVQELDSLRNQSFSQIFPELAKSINP